MLTIQVGNGETFCDGMSRPEFLMMGGLALGGMFLMDVLAAGAKAGIKTSHKTIIVVFLPGVPPHQDIFDLKPDAPSDIRGDFKPIKTNARGIEICEHLPKIAAMTDKFTGRIKRTPSPPYGRAIHSQANSMSLQIDRGMTGPGA
jgi:hypothetical protein